MPNVSDLPSDVVAAYVAGAFTIIALLIGAVFSAVTGVLTIKRSFKERNGQLAISISTAIAQQPELAIRFAVGVLKVELFGENDEVTGITRFVPLNARITMGRGETNEFILKDVNNTISRVHCGLVSDGRNVYIEDYASVNGTKLNENPVTPGKPKKLKNGDVIALPALGRPVFVVTFFTVHHSSFW